MAHVVFVFSFVVGVGTSLTVRPASAGFTSVGNWRLNERHYGGLTGLNKAETMEKYGKDQVQIWRRSYDVKPPAMPVSARLAPVIHDGW